MTIANPFNPGQLLSLKDTYLDIKAVLVDGSIVVIEMQVARMAGFNKRVAYNLAKAYANQLETGEDYLLLNPAIAVTITDFIVFDNNENINEIISSFKPPIFWKEKDIVRKQVQSWSTEEVKEMIIKINGLETLVKKNSANSMLFVSDFVSNY